MADIDKLRPEVRNAVEYLHDAATLGNGTPLDEAAHVRTVRAELLRLAMIETDALIALDCEHDWQVMRERAEKAEAELAALKARTRWQPIETAPKDGTIVLVTAACECSGLNGKTAIVIESAYWHDGAWNGNQDNRSILEQDWPTHWMPLPPPPAEQGD